MSKKFILNVLSLGIAQKLVHGAGQLLPNFKLEMR